MPSRLVYLRYVPAGGRGGRGVIVLQLSQPETLIRAGLFFYFQENRKSTSSDLLFFVLMKMSREAKLNLNPEQQFRSHLVDEGWTSLKPFFQMNNITHGVHPVQSSDPVFTGGLWRQIVEVRVQLVRQAVVHAVM